MMMIDNEQKEGESSPLHNSSGVYSGQRPTLQNYMPQEDFPITYENIIKDRYDMLSPEDSEAFAAAVNKWDMLDYVALVLADAQVMGGTPEEQIEKLYQRRENRDVVIRAQVRGGGNAQLN